MKRGITPQPMTPIQLEKILFCALAELSKGPERFADFLFALVGKSLSSIIPAPPNCHWYVAFTLQIGQFVRWA